MTDFVEVPLLLVDPEGRFDYTAANDLLSALMVASKRLEEKAGLRPPYVSTGQDGFTGHFADVFAANGAVAASDAARLLETVQSVRDNMATMCSEAAKEDERRQENNEWVRHHNERGAAEQKADSLFGETRPPHPERSAAPTFPAADVTVKPRQPYAPGGTGWHELGEARQPALLRGRGARYRQ